ncbi:MAG: thioredoxin [Endomicrobiales bacterium]
MEHLTLESFKEKVFDFESKKEWEFKGKLPAIIDFYADWCGPCKMVGPVLEALAEDYKGRIAVYKLNTDEQQELAGLFGISSIPSILFIPREGKPQMAVGALPREALVKAISDVLKVEKDAQ